MLTIVFETVLDYVDYVDWHVGEKLDNELFKQEHDRTELRPIAFVQADGDELEYIIKFFPSIPIAYRAQYPNSIQSSAKVPVLLQRWRGDLAAFIADNLPRK